MKRSVIALALASVVAFSGLAGCSNTTQNSLPNGRPTADHPTPAPSKSAPGIGNISFCVGQSDTHQLHNPVTIAVYRGTDVLGLKNTVVAHRIVIPVAAGQFDVIVDNVVMLSGFVSNGQTIKGQSGRFCPN